VSLEEVRDDGRLAGLYGAHDGLFDPGAAGIGLSVPAFSAPAHHPLRVQDHVSHLARRAPVACVQAPVEDDASAQAGAHKHGDHILCATPGAKAVFPHRTHVHIVIDDHPQAEGLREPGP